MPNTFTGTGNLGAAPELRYVPVKGESKPVLDMRVMFDDYKRDADGEFKQVGGFWLNVSMWGDRAEHICKILTKGARIHVVGRLQENEWTDKSGELKKTLVCTADEIHLSLSRVSTVEWREKQHTDAPETNTPQEEHAESPPSKSRKKPEKARN